MSRRKFLVGIILVLLVAGGVAAAAFLRNDVSPLPADEAVARTGFAAWPVDTPEEARAECAEAPDARKDPKQVALAFASDVMGYPDPTVDNDLAAEDEGTYRTLINSNGVPGVFLGSVLTIERFGECWYVTEGEPREGSREVSVVTLEEGTRLLLDGCAEIGWGEWVHTPECKGGQREVMIDIPEEAIGHPGHYITTSFDQHGVSESVGASALPPLPTSAGAEPAAALDVGRRPEDRGLCRMTWARRRHPERIIGHLREWSFRGGLALTGGYQRFDSRSQRRLGSESEWRVRLDEADLRFNFSRAGGRCWIIRSIVPRGPRIIEQVSVGDNSITFDLDPGRADKVVVYYGVGREAQSVSIATKRILDEPFSVSRGPDFPPDNEGLPAYALTITYRNGNMHSAEYRLFEMPGRGS